MKRVWRELQAGRSRVAKHPFFGWLASDELPLERRFVFAPVMIDFIMGFADLNKWFLSYSEPQNELERAINQHTEEDRTHSRLFYDNWYTLALGEVADWPPGKMLWWLFHSSDAAIVRRFGMDLLALSSQNADPLVRFPMMEAIEICGDVFFGNTVAIASELTSRYEVPHLYFGKHHRALETGHLHTDERALATAQLSAEQAERATFMVQHVYGLFERVLDRLLEYGRRAANYPRLLRELEGEYLDALNPPLRAASNHAPSLAAVAPPAAATPARNTVERRLAERVAELARHPLLAWLASDAGPDDRDKLRGFTALWGVDIAGYKDFNELVLRYPEPQSALEAAINAWTENLAAHGALYLRDWQALDMDRVLRWNAGETIAFYFLSSETELHRRNMARVKHHAFRSKDPLVRFWLVKALESSGEVLFDVTSSLAGRVEHEYGVTLDYWANRHEIAHRAGVPESRDIDALFTARTLTPEQDAAACRAVDTIFDNMHEQFSLSLDAASKQVFIAEPRSLPPPRISGIVYAQELALDRRAG